MAMILSAETLTGLKCSTCGCYLSLGPVKRSSSGYNCGRCPSQSEEVNAIFESIARACKFPCRYHTNGCKKKLLFGTKVINHEKICEYNLSSCPLGGKCGWQGAMLKIYEHCVKEHPEQVLESFCLEIDLKVPFEALNVFKCDNGEVLLLHLYYDLEKGFDATITWCRRKYRDHHYIAIIKDSITDKTLANQTNEEVDCSTSPKDKMQILIPIDSSKFTNHAKILFQVISKNDQSCDFCESVLPLCFLMCSNDHNLCKQCEREKCIKCDAPLQIRSNYSVMKAGSSFACCNTVYGCTFYGPMEQLRMHEKQCMVQKCIVDYCNWKGVFSRFPMHVHNSHSPIKSVPDITLDNFNCQTFVVLNAVSCQRCPPYFHQSDFLYVVCTSLNSSLQTVSIAANLINNKYSIVSHGQLKIIVGDSYTTYNIELPAIQSGILVDYKKSITIPLKLLLEHKPLKISLSGFLIDCSGKYVHPEVM